MISKSYGEGFRYRTGVQCDLGLEGPHKQVPSPAVQAYRVKLATI